MPQVNYAGSAEVIEEDYYEYDMPPDLTVRLDISGRVYRLQLRGKAKANCDTWYNDCSIVEIVEGHV